MAFWYHFAILFEALFILTTVDAGTRVGRFMIQDLVGNVVHAFQRHRVVGRQRGWLRRGLRVLWGYFLYQGVVDPLGGINTLWPLFGIANQMLAAIALTLCTVVLFKMKRQRYAWVTIVPTAWLVICTLTAGLEKVFSPNPAVGFLSHAHEVRRRDRRGQGAGAGQVAGCDGPGRVQRLRRCDAGGSLRRTGRGDGDLRHHPLHQGDGLATQHRHRGRRADGRGR